MVANDYNVEIYIIHVASIPLNCLRNEKPDKINMKKINYCPTSCGMPGNKSIAWPQNSVIRLYMHLKWIHVTFYGLGGMHV